MKAARCSGWLLSQATPPGCGGAADPAVWTGWMLALFFIFLILFNARKRLVILPLGSASAWLLAHVITGLGAIALFWLHAGSLWPQGLYEQMLAALFYLITLNGLAGYILQKIVPPRLTQTGVEVIYERIPAEIAEIRGAAEALLAVCAKETQSDGLTRQYRERLAWFFARPRFFLRHACAGGKGARWIRREFAMVKPRLSVVETAYLEKLAHLAEIKNKIDFHYAAQGMMKGWLFLHLPLGTALLLLAVWHILLVHLYAL